MKNTLMGTETVPTEGFHLVQKLYSFLDIPGAAWDLVLLIYLFCCSKRPSRVRAAPQREISDLGFSSDLSQCGDLVGLSEAFSPQWGEAGQPVRLGLFGFQIGPSRRGQLPFQTEDGGFPVSNGRTTQAVPGIVQTQC